MDAEVAYIFRHALVRDAAYELQPPHERTTLHALAHDVIARLFEGRSDELDGFAIELARHAGAAGDGAWPLLECEWLDRAAQVARARWRGAEAAALFTRVARHAAADAKRRSAAFCGLGKSLIDIGRLPEALGALECAVEHAPSDTWRLNALRPLSYAYRNVGRNDDALAAARSMEQIGRDSSNPQERALVLDAIATALMGMERNEEALGVAQQAVELAQGIEPGLRGGMRASLGLVLGRLGRRDEGIAVLRQAVADLEVSDARRSLAAARRNLADQLRSSGRPQEALPVCESALREMQTLGDTRGEGMATLTMGGLLRDLARPEQALPLYARAAALLATCGDLRAAAVCHCNRATALLDLGRFDECRDALRAGEQAAEAADAPRVLAMVAAGRGDLLRDQHHWAPAAEQYAAAHELYTRVSDASQASWMLAERAISLKRAGEPGASAVWATALDALASAAPRHVLRYTELWGAAT